MSYSLNQEQPTCKHLTIVAFLNLMNTFVATLPVYRTKKTQCRGRTTSPMGRHSASSTPSASCTTTLTSSSWVTAPHSSHPSFSIIILAQLLVHYLAEYLQYLPKCAQAEEKEVPYKFYTWWTAMF
jgi:hypothetical protein